MDLAVSVQTDDNPNQVTDRVNVHYPVMSIFEHETSEGEIIDSETCKGPCFEGDQLEFNLLADFRVDLQIEPSHGSLCFPLVAVNVIAVDL